MAVASVAGTGPGGLVTRADVEAATALERRRASPLARRLARERGLDLRHLAGSGPAGAVLVADLDRAAGPATPGEPVVAPPSGAPATPAPPEDAARAAVGALMARSKREIPHYHLDLLVDLSGALRWLEERNRAAVVAERVLPVALILRATAIAALEVDGVNGWYRDGRYERSERVDLGVAVARRGGGLIAPVVVGADALALPELMTALAGMLSRAKAGRLRASEMGEPSLTVTSLGDAGADAVQPVIYPPQVAMLGVGRIAERPWAEHGMLAVRPTVQLTLAADHRVTNGHEGSRFLRTVERLLQEPEVL